MTQIPEGLAKARAKMQDAGVSDAAIETFSHYYRELEAGATGLIAEDAIEPLTEVASLDEVEVPDAVALEAMSRTVVVKLNGGLGTSMGMTKAKSLLPVRGEQTFLDLIVEQVRAARAATGAKIPLLLMNSFSTDEDTRVALHDYPDLAVEGVPMTFLQSQEPKLRTDTLEPVEWPEDPSLEWCPPGHGDLYPSLFSSGVLEALLAAGFRYMSVSNSDNLGAVPDPALAGWFAASKAPFASEVCRRTAADVKGGHLARRREDGRLVLRETAQTSDEDMKHFTDGERHPYFNINNLWFDLEAMADKLKETGGVLGLPLIRNTKTVDPKDPETTEVYQIETAMGAGIEVFDGAQVIEVPRSRFLPVKTTNDLLVLRSDVYEQLADGTLSAVTAAPLVTLDSSHYKKIADFDARFPAGPPSLREATALRVEGDWTFGADVVVRGDVELETAEPRRVEDGTELSGD